jgi:hypothetical protein
MNAPKNTEVPSEFIVMKSSRIPAGVATKAHAYHGVVYPTEEAAQEAAAAFTRRNPVGFRVIKLG